MGEVVIAVGSSCGIRYGNIIPLLPSLILLVVIFVIIVPKGGNREKTFISTPRSLLLLYVFCWFQSLCDHT